MVETHGRLGRKNRKGFYDYPEGGKAKLWPGLKDAFGDSTEIPMEDMKEQFARGIPLKRFGRPEDIAGPVAFLASDDAGFITGSTISANGGQFFV